MSLLTIDDINQLSYNELRSQCKKAKLGGTGKADVLRQRLLDAHKSQNTTHTSDSKPKAEEDDDDKATPNDQKEGENEGPTPKEEERDVDSTAKKEDEQNDKPKTDEAKDDSNDNDNNTTEASEANTNENGENTEPEEDKENEDDSETKTNVNDGSSKREEDKENEDYSKTKTNVNDGSPKPEEDKENEDDSETNTNENDDNPKPDEDNETEDLNLKPKAKEENNDNSAKPTEDSKPKETKLSDSPNPQKVKEIEKLQLEKLQAQFPVEDLICPITREIPWNPVTAEDGRVYERAAIEQHLKTKRTSPMTNQPMGDRLFPAPQHKNLIEGLIKTGVIGDSLLSSWNEKVKEKKEIEDLLKKANAGDKNVMLTVGLNYRYGEKGFAKDLTKSHILMKKGHDYGNLECTVFLGADLLTGTGVAQDLMKGMMYTAMAAGNGSDLAAYVLGSALATGIGGVTVDKDEAIRWLWKASSGTCPVKHLNEMEKDRAKKLLKSLTNKAPATDPSA